MADSTGKSLPMIRLAAIASIFFLLLTSCISNKVFAQSNKTIIVQGDIINLSKDTVVRNKLLRLNLRKFEGRTVKELLQNDTVKLYKNYWWSDEPPGKLQSLNLTFARGLYLCVFVDTLKYQPRFSEWNRFSFDKFLNEKVSAVKLDRDFFEENVVKKYSKCRTTNAQQCIAASVACHTTMRLDE